MPRRSAACMTVWPSGTSTLRPSISSVGMEAGRVRGRAERAAAERRVLLELGAVLGDDRAGGHRRRVGERADGGTHHVAGDAEQQVDVARLGAAVLEILEHAVEPARPLAARRALPAGLVVEEALEDE